MTGILPRAAIVCACVALASAAWLYAPDLAESVGADDLSMLASLAGALAALTAAGWLEDQFH